MTPEEAAALPGAFTAFRRTDGELMMGEYAWMAEHWGECDWCDDPVEYEEVVMVPVRVRLFTCHEPPEPEDDE